MKKIKIGLTDKQAIIILGWLAIGKDDCQTKERSEIQEIQDIIRKERKK